MLPAIAFSAFAKRFKLPSLEEGFADLTTVEFEVSQRLARGLLNVLSTGAGNN